MPAPMIAISAWIMPLLTVWQRLASRPAIMHALVLVTSLGGLAALLVIAAWGDITRFTIPNRLNAAIALLAPAYWWAAHFPMAAVGVQLLLAAGVFILFALAFAAGMMGG